MKYNAIMKTNKESVYQFRMTNEYKERLDQASRDFDVPISDLVIEGLNHRVVERYSSMAAILYRLAAQEEKAGNHEQAEIRKELFGEFMEKAYAFANDSDTLQRVSEWLAGMEKESEKELQKA